MILSLMRNERVRNKVTKEIFPLKHPIIALGLQIIISTLPHNPQYQSIIKFYVNILF